MNTTKVSRSKLGFEKVSRLGNLQKPPLCYGYKVTSEGKLVAYPTEAIIVFHIFERFADGDSLGKIAASLARMKVKSPTGKELWTRETISKILSNEKYVGDVILGKTQVQNGVQVKMVDHTSQTVINGHHEAIISRELFDIVQQEKAHRSRLKSHSHVA
ncbi:recombinase family protein [Flavonifractor plautii]|nr:recombinase family protein [Flavonifractor plautii]